MFFLRALTILRLYFAVCWVFDPVSNLDHASTLLRNDRGMRQQVPFKYQESYFVLVRSFKCHVEMPRNIQYVSKGPVKINITQFNVTVHRG